MMQSGGSAGMASGGPAMLIMLPFLVTLIGAIGTIFVRLLAHPRDRYYDGVRRLQRHRWEALEAVHSDTTPTTSELKADGGVQAASETSGGWEMPTEIPEEETKRDTKRDEGFELWDPPSRDTARWVIGCVLDSGTEPLPDWVDLDDSDTVDDGIALLEEPRVLYRDCRCSFRQSFWLFILAWLPATAASVGVFLPQSPPVLGFEIVLSTVALLAFCGAVLKAYSYWWTRKQLDSQIERTEMF